MNQTHKNDLPQLPFPFSSLLTFPSLPQTKKNATQILKAEIGKFQYNFSPLKFGPQSSHIQEKKFVFLLISSYLFFTIGKKYLCIKVWQYLWFNSIKVLEIDKHFLLAYIYTHTSPTELKRNKTWKPSWCNVYILIKMFCSVWASSKWFWKFLHFFLIKTFSK